MKRLVQYEMMSSLRSVFTPVFGIVFPLLMIILMVPGVTSGLSGVKKDYILVSLFITLSQIIPLVMGFIGFAAIYAQELEQKIPFRLRLFGISEGKQLCAKIITSLILFVFSYVVYVLVSAFYLQIPQLTVWNVLFLFLFLLFEMVGLVILAYAICLYFKKFGPAYAVVMILYFVIMFLGGMMGMRDTDMPEVIQKITRLFPFSYISFDMYKMFFNMEYNLMPFIQSLAFFVGLTIVLCVVTIRFKGAKSE